MEAAELKLDTLDAGGLRSLLDTDSSDVLLLNVWATWCKPCRTELPELVRLHREYGSRNVRLVLLSADEIELAESEVLPALRQTGVSFPSFIKHEKFSDEAMINALDSAWSGALPATFLFNKERERSQTLVGERSYGEFEEAVLKVQKR